MNVARFREVFPEFADPALYPDPQIQFNIDLATASLPPQVWGDRLEFGIAYYAAHYVALAGARRPAIAGGPVGGSSSSASGLVASKSAGGLSISFDTTTGQTEGGGSFNLTRYGQEYLTLRDSISIGARQL